MKLQDKSFFLPGHETSRRTAGETLLHGDGMGHEQAEEGLARLFFLLCSFVSIAGQYAATDFALPGQTEASLVPSPVINLGDRDGELKMR